MFGLSREFRHRLALIILKTTLYGSWLLGLFPFTFDCRRRRIRRSRLLQIYGLFLNNFLLSTMLYWGFENFDKNGVEAFKRNTVLQIINILIGSISMFSGFVVYFMNFWGCMKIQQIVNELLALEYQDFDGLNEKICPKFNSLLIQKSVTILGQLLSFLTVNYGIPGNDSPPKLMLISLLMIISLNINLLHFHVGVLLIYRYLWLINGQLSDLVNQLKVDPTVDSSRVRKFISVYCRLLDLKENLVSAFQLQLTIVQMSCLSGNIVIIYFFVVLQISMRQNEVSLAAFPQALLTNIWDFWLCIVQCDLTETTGKKTSTILRQFNDFVHTNEELERSLNEFAMLCSHRKFRVQFFGLFSINCNTGFKILITTTLYFICLLQFDYMNL
ncbi:putative gustatory receptor 22b [Drosophila ficusphila]|uniref:putative gustatory receptor 22b n=1 Tax=Drosophila ficusphila TaxID=30025 RepID=UPI001C89A1EF|nr:putative gustatory receptor 22b [Drosophila ficusphila]